MLQEIEKVAQDYGWSINLEWLYLHRHFHQLLTEMFDDNNEISRSYQFITDDYADYTYTKFAVYITKFMIYDCCLEYLNYKATYGKFNAALLERMLSIVKSEQ